MCKIKERGYLVVGDLGWGLDTVAFRAIEVEDGGAMDDTINGGHGGHFIFEDFVPIFESKIGANHQTFTFIAMSHEVKKHLHFPLALLYVADVV